MYNDFALKSILKKRRKISPAIYFNHWRLLSLFWDILQYHTVSPFSLHGVFLWDFKPKFFVIIQYHPTFFLHKQRRWPAFVSRIWESRYICNCNRLLSNSIIRTNNDETDSLTKCSRPANNLKGTRKVPIIVNLLHVTVNL